MQSLHVAILGATGTVGESLLDILAQRNFPLSKLTLLASARSAGKTLLYNNKPHIVQDVEGFDFKGVDIALFSAGGDVSAIYAPIAAAAGCVVIDNTSHFRYEKDIPLIVPEVNLHCLKDYKNKNIIANPNCSTIQMLVALKPLHDYAKIKRINVCTYQSVSGSGYKGIVELASHTGARLNGQTVKSKVYSSSIAFNVIPHIDKFMDNGYTKEEMKMVWETQKILEDESILVNPTAVRVPVFFGHSEAINIETEIKLTKAKAIELLQQAPGVKVCSQDEEYPTPVTHAAEHDEVFVGRIREDISTPNGLNLWVVADNIRKGAALNSVQIAEKLLDYL